MSDALARAFGDFTDPSNTLKIWLFAPGTRGSAWPAQHEAAVIAMGFSSLALGDLSAFTNQKQLYAHIDRATRESGITNPQKSFFDSWRNLIKPGHIVIARSGLSKVLALGVVTGEYYYQEDPPGAPLERYNHRRKVRWVRVYDGEGGELDHRVINFTRATIAQYATKPHRLAALAEFLQVRPEDLYGTLLAIANAHPPEHHAPMPTPDRPAEANTPSTNLILYGPPGTGKTYAVRQLVDMLRRGEAITQETLRARLRDQAGVASDLSAETTTLCTFHQSLSYEEFIEGLRPTQAGGFEVVDGLFKTRCEQASRDADDETINHFMVIDEINRGNISKIFGELITLVEPSKRIGASDELRAQLPYSQEEFGVPGNLHLIGTMNTADRSIAMLDAALRRRFRFIAMYPDPEVLRRTITPKTLGELAARLLTVINQRVEVLHDRDHTIGHAYFLGIQTLSDLRDVIVDSVLPLLGEYFYEDMARVAAVLNCANRRTDGVLIRREIAHDALFEDVPDGLGASTDTYALNPTLVSGDEVQVWDILNTMLMPADRVQRGDL